MKNIFRKYFLSSEKRFPKLQCFFTENIICKQLFLLLKMFSVSHFLSFEKYFLELKHFLMENVLCK